MYVLRVFEFCVCNVCSVYVMFVKLMLCMLCMYVLVCVCNFVLCIYVCNVYVMCM